MLWYLPESIVKYIFILAQELGISIKYKLSIYKICIPLKSKEYFSQPKEKSLFNNDLIDLTNKFSII